LDVENLSLHTLTYTIVRISSSNKKTLKIKYTIYILFSVIFSHQISAENFINNNFFADPPDTIPIKTAKISDFVEEEDFSEEEDTWGDAAENSNEFFLAGFPMENWDTLKVNPFNLDFKKFKDTCNIKLIFDNQCDYAHPTCGAVSSEFGFRRTRYHYGIDIDLETGDPVLAAFEGLIRISKYSPSYGYYVVIRHQNGLETLYAHLSELKVSVGAYVQAGDLIGLGGNTGRSRGSHLHFEVRFKGQQINPREIIDFKQFTYVNEDLLITPKSFQYLAQAKGSGSYYYKIKKGDTLSKIASKNRTTVSRICKLNKIKTTTILKPGRTLRLS
jgi:murein DD-endopeptidase MepM/ murein hydrolase activator NlpD